MLSYFHLSDCQLLFPQEIILGISLFHHDSCTCVFPATSNNKVFKKNYTPQQMETLIFRDYREPTKKRFLHIVY